MIISLNKWGNWGTERLRNFLEATQPVSGWDDSCPGSVGLQCLLSVMTLPCPPPARHSPCPQGNHSLLVGGDRQVGLVAQSCLTLCDPMDRSPPGSSVHGISQERIQEWVAISFSRETSWPRNWTLSHIAGRFFTVWTTRKAHIFNERYLFVHRSLKTQRAGSSSSTPGFVLPLAFSLKGPWNPRGTGISESSSHPDLVCVGSYMKHKTCRNTHSHCSYHQLLPA